MIQFFVSVPSLPACRPSVRELPARCTASAQNPDKCMVRGTAAQRRAAAVLRGPQLAGSRGPAPDLEGGRDKDTGADALDHVHHERWCHECCALLCEFALSLKLAQIFLDLPEFARGSNRCARPCLARRAWSSCSGRWLQAWMLRQWGWRGGGRRRRT
jgi:hypothetical protein